MLIDQTSAGLCAPSEQKVKVGHCPRAQISPGTGRLLLKQQTDGSAHAAPDTATHTHNVQKTSSTNFSGMHLSEPQMYEKQHSGACSYSNKSCRFANCQHMLTRYVAWSDSWGTRPGFLQRQNSVPVSHKPPHSLPPSPCGATRFPVRLACLANLPQRLHVNLTSWQADWSVSKMTWLARRSVLLFGSCHLQVSFKWVTTARSYQECPNEAAQHFL